MSVDDTRELYKSGCPGYLEKLCRSGDGVRAPMENVHKMMNIFLVIIKCV
jgi:hypothetical protein